MCRWATAVRPRGSIHSGVQPAGLGPAPRCGTTVAVDAASSHLHEMAGQGPQPETLFRPDAATLSSGPAAAAAAASSSGGGEEKPLKEGELPGFGGLPVGPDYGAERPQEQSAPEPENPLPGDLPPNHPQREGEAPPDGPGPLEVPPPRRDEPDQPLKTPPEVGAAAGPGYQSGTGARGSGCRLSTLGDGMQQVLLARCLLSAAAGALAIAQPDAGPARRAPLASTAPAAARACLQFVPSPGPVEAPPRNIPTEVPTPSAPPEFTPGTPTELPQRGGSEISFPGSEVNFP